MTFHLCDFAPLIQLGATFNFGCIALSGNNSFAKSLANYFFEVEKTIENQIREIQSTLVIQKNARAPVSQLDASTKEALERIGKNIESDIEKLQEEYEAFGGTTESKKKELQNTIPDKYTPKYLDHICLFLGFYCVFELAFASWFKINSNIIVPYFIFNTLVLFGVIGFICLDLFKKENLLLIVTKNAVSSANLFAAFFIITIALSAINSAVPKKFYYTEFWIDFYFVLGGVLLPFLGLFFYYFYVMYLSRKAHKEIKEMVKLLKKDLSLLDKKNSELQHVVTYFYKGDTQIGDSSSEN